MLHVFMNTIDEALDTFHRRCVHTVLGITNRRQWKECSSSEKVSEQWGDYHREADEKKVRVARSSCPNACL